MNKWSKVTTLEDKPRSGWPLFFKCVRNVIEKAVSICVTILQNRKIKKFNFKISKFRAQQYEDLWPTKIGKPWREKGGAHADMVSEGFANFTAKGDRLANSRDVNPLETIWIFVDETTYKDQAPKTLDELRQWLRFAWKKCFLDTFRELVHSIPYHLENVRNIKTFWLLIFQIFSVKWIINNILKV